MQVYCPHCAREPGYVIDFRTIVRFGGFRRSSDSKYVERYRCKVCKKTFSKATFDRCVEQKKRQKNLLIFRLLASGVSGRRTARLVHVNRKTVARKLIFLGEKAREDLFLQTAFAPTNDLQFDDLETFEHSKCKPVSITLAVEHKTRRILGFRVASMSPKGSLVAKAKRLYGQRMDERTQMRRSLFQELAPSVAPAARITSDSNPYYTKDVKRYFADAKHLTVLSRRGAITGQAELKKIGFDPLFSLNHTCAMFRANVSRLIRKTWCTTKRRARLADHLAIYAIYHNAHLKI